MRAAAVYELGADDGEALHALAREDAEPRVRRSAVTRIDDVAILGEIARTDPDEDVRAEAVRGLAGVAAEADQVEQAIAASRQLLALGRTKEIVLVARASSSPAVRAAIIDLIEDPKALGSVSRHAQDSSTRLRALARLNEPEEILNVAIKSEHTDAAVAALERITDREALAAIAQRARNKVAARRGRAKLRLLDEPVAPAQDELAVRMNADDRQRAVALLHTAESLVAVADPDEAAARLADARMAWAEMQADVEVEPVLVQQFESASDAVREAIAERRQERAADDERQQAIAREQADRVAICEELERLTDGDALDRVAELKVRWDSLPPMPSDCAASLNRRFQDASRAFEDRERRRVLAHAAFARLETLATELEQLVASEQPLEEVIARWRGLRRDADVLREHASANAAAAERLERAIATLEEKEHQQQEVRARQEQDNLRRLHQVCRQVELLAASEQITLKAGDRALRDIRAAIDDRAPVPSKKDRQEIQARLDAARINLGPRVQQLRDADEWQRWANLQVQEELCKSMEALKGEENLETAGRKMRELQSRWKQVALAPRAQGETMWRRFKTAQDEVFNRTATHFAAQNEERAGNLTRKLALCERAETLATSNDWVKAATEIQTLQAEWKTIGPVSRGHEKAVWERFRAACDTFFTRRQEDLKRRKDEWSINLAKKEALCAQAEALADSTEWDAASVQAKHLQTEWKTTGPVRKSKSDAIWQRFRTACDRFFDRYKHRDQMELLAKAAPRDEVIRELEALLPAEDADLSAAPDNLHAAVQQARTKWQQAPELPRPMQQDLTTRYHDVLARLVRVWPAAFGGTDLDPEGTRLRMEKLLAKVEELLPESGQPQAAISPAERLAQQWRERLAANTMGGARTATENDDARWRAAEQEVRNAQAQWTRLGPVPADVAGPLNERFQRACRRFYDQRRKAS